MGLIPEMHKRGLHKRVLRALMIDPIKYSPMKRVENLSVAAAEIHPPVSLFHGSSDATVPWTQTGNCHTEIPWRRESRPRLQTSKCKPLVSVAASQIPDV